MTSGRIEELPDDFDASIDLNKAPAAGPAPATADKDASLAEMYAKRLDMPNALSDKSFEELMLDMSKTPLFMTAEDVANQSE